MSETKDETAIVEAMARAMAIADGRDPDGMLFAGARGFILFWMDYEPKAKAQYHAHLAMLQAIEDLDRREASEFTRRLDKQGTA